MRRRSSQLGPSGSLFSRGPAASSTLYSQLAFYGLALSLGACGTRVAELRAAHSITNSTRGVRATQAARVKLAETEHAIRRIRPGLSVADEERPEVCYQRANALPVTGSSGNWQLRDEGGDKRVEKLGLLSTQTGDWLELSPALRFASHASGRIGRHELCAVEMKVCDVRDRAQGRPRTRSHDPSTSRHAYTHLSSPARD